MYIKVPLNLPVMSVTAPVFHLLTSPINDEAPWNIQTMSFTAAVFQLLTSPLNGPDHNSEDQKEPLLVLHTNFVQQ